MITGFLVARAALVLPLIAVAGLAQVAVSGRVVDETGAAVAGAAIELRAPGQAVLSASSDLAGHFSLSLPAGGDYAIRAERKGFYVYQAASQRFEEAPSELTITLNHLQDFSDRIDVTYSPPAIDPKQPADSKELDNTEIQSVPYAAPQDYRNALPMMDGVVQDNQGRAHFNGGDTNQASYALDGFNIADPVTGTLETRLNIDTVQSMEVVTSRFSADNGRGSSGAVDLHTKMGDDRWRFGGTNFIPGASTEGGLHINKWTPRLELSGPIEKGRAWFYQGVDLFYSNDTVPGLPRGENRTAGVTGSSLTRFQVNLRPSNILTGSFLANLSDASRSGLSILTPAEATVDRRQTLFMSTVRDQLYYHGALVEMGFADSRGVLRYEPQGDQLYEITPLGNLGNYFDNLDRHFYRQQWVGNAFLQPLRFWGTHQLKFGVDFERESFHERDLLHDYEVVREDNSVARYVTFAGPPYEGHKNFEGAQYVQDSWTPREGWTIEAGLRTEWNEVVRALEVAPRLAAAWSPRVLHGTKFAAGWGVYYDAINLSLITHPPDQVSLSTFYPTDGSLPIGPVPTSFSVNERALEAPFSRTASASIEQKLPHSFYLRSDFTHRTGEHGLVFMPPPASVAEGFQQGAVFQLSNSRRDWYNAVDLSLRHTFAAKFEWFAGYTRSSAHSNAAVDFNLENPIFGPQGPGPYPWDATNRFHTWGWVPLPKNFLPAALQFLVRNTSAQYLVEYRTGFPFNVVDQDGFLVGQPGSMRFPGYFNINLAFERQFRALHYLWAWRVGLVNLTNNGDPNVVNNIIGTPQYLTYGRGQARAVNVRLRLLGRK